MDYDLSANCHIVKFSNCHIVYYKSKVFIRFVTMTIHEARLKLQFVLMSHYEDREAANIADLVLEKLTGWSRIERVVNKTVPLSPQQEEQLAHYTERLGRQEPVQYVLEEAWFAGWPFHVNHQVLIPRPETEELVDWIATDVRSTKYDVGKETMENVHRTPDIVHVLDIGTGSGCIPVTLKKNFPDLHITAIDISSEALYVAVDNAARYHTEIDFRRVDFLNPEEWAYLETYDIIVSNPPYIPATDRETMQKHVLDWEPHQALFVPDTDALVFYRAISLFGKSHLNPGGAIYLEIHESLGKEVLALFSNAGYPSIELRRDLQGKDRMVRAGPL